MKRIFLAGSKKFYPKLQTLQKQLTALGAKPLTTMTGNLDTSTQGEISALHQAFDLILQSDEVYVYAPNGYIGLTVAMEIAYTYANTKPLYSSEKIQDPSVAELINSVVDIPTYLEKISNSNLTQPR